MSCKMEGFAFSATVRSEEAYGELFKRTVIRTLIIVKQTKKVVKTFITHHKIIYRRKL